MNIENLKIDNYKSLVDFNLESPNAFSVFVGPNASGKSNIFEAIELITLCNFMSPFEAIRLYGLTTDLLNRKINFVNENIKLSVKLESLIKPSIDLKFNKTELGEYGLVLATSSDLGLYNLNEKDMSSEYNSYMEKIAQSDSYKQFFNFSRIFVSNSKLVKRNIQDDKQLALDASNLEKVLKRLLKDENKKADIIEWLQLLIPGFEKIEIVNEPLSGSDNLLIYEKGTNKPFTKNLISDGTYNILSILTAVYQSDEPQFLCIEEPENGLNPKVIKELVNLFRQKCEEGHFIWLNTHSQTLVSELTTEEIIIIDKKDGVTIPKQIKGMNLHGLKMDEALLTNVLGGGIPW